MRFMRVCVCFLAVLGILGGPARAQFGPAPVHLEPVVKRKVRREVEILGTAEARRRSVISAEVAGRVEKMVVDAGDYVREGDPLCRMRALPVELQLQQAAGQLVAAEAELRKMEQGYRPEEVAQAQARFKAAKAGLDRWTQDYARTEKLLADGASTPAEMDSVKAAYRQATESLAEAEAYLRLVTSGFRKEDVDAVRGRVASQTAAVAELKDTLDKMTVRMPFDGFVVVKHTEEGQWLSPSAPVVEVVDLGVVRVLLDVPERHLASLAKGAETPVVFEALGNGRRFTGKLSQIVPASAEGTHTVAVRVDVPNEIEAGRPAIAAGLLARVWLPVGNEHEALLVPKDALIRQGGRDLVYTIADTPPPGADIKKPEPPKTDAEKETAKMVQENTALIGEALQKAGVPSPPVKYAVAIPVRILGGYRDYQEVESEGLKEGTPLVTRGTYLLTHGAAVQVRPKEKVPAKAGATQAGGQAGGAE